MTLNIGLKSVQQKMLFKKCRVKCMNCNSCKGRGEDLSTAFKEQLWESFL